MENGNIKTLDVSHGYSLSLIEARRFTEDEKKGYAKWFQESGLVGIGDHVRLENLTTDDELVEEIRQRDYIGEFRGCDNQAYEISGEEWNALIERDKAAEKAKKISKLKAIIAQCESTIAKCESVEHLYTAEEAKAKAEYYNLIMNEGGEGYIPHYYTIGEYESAKKWMAETIAELEAL